MTDSQQSRINHLFDRALDLEEPERSAFLQSACAGDEQLRQAVDDLLEGRGAAEGFLSDETSGANKLAPVFSSGDTVAQRFRILRFRGRGGMGEVYEAYDSILRERIGLKTLRADLTPDSDALDRFKREIRVAHQVTHPNLCRIYDLIEHRPNGRGDEESAVVACLTMQWLEGETLQALLERTRPLPVSQALSLAEQVAAALDALHEAGIVHRDLKPGNIMLVPQGDGSKRAVLTDFGLAKPVSGGREWYETTTDAQAGAPYFMAPEQLKNKKPTQATDIYAFGLVLDEMVTGSRAFSAGSLAALYYQRLWEEPTPAGSRAADLPSGWDTAIRRCLEVEPELRPASASEVIRMIVEEQAPVENAPVRPTVEDVPAPKGSPKPGARSLPRWMIVPAAAVAAFAILLVLGGVPGDVSTSVKVFDIGTAAESQKFEYLARGTTAEILRRLTTVEGVRVIPARATRGRESEPAASSAQFLLDGSMREQDGRARLAMTLTDGRDGSLIWSEEFEERRLDDAVQFQNRIARGAINVIERRVLANTFVGRKFPLVASLVAPVRDLLGQAWSSQVTRAPTQDAEALNLYFRGSKLYEEASPASAEAAINYYDQALERDPTFALAMSASADAYIYLKNLDAQNSTLYLERARTLAESAVRTDPRLAEAHTALAAAKQAGWDWDGAEKSYQEAFRLNSGFARAHRWYCGLLIQFGRFEEALKHGQRAMDLDPHDRATPAAFGLYLFLAGRAEHAVAVMEPAVRNLESISTRYNLAEVYAYLGSKSRGEERQTYFNKALDQARVIQSVESRAGERSGAATHSDHLFAHIYSLAGDRTAAEPYFTRTRSAFRQRSMTGLPVAFVYAAQNRPDEALAVLEQAVAYRDPALLYIKVVPFLENLRDQPRFQALLAQMRL